MKETILYDILKEKEIKEINETYTKFDIDRYNSMRIPEITIHGRFQPPLHVNHFYTYVATGFRIAEKVHVLLTNPDNNETRVLEATHRNSIENNPFSYDERVTIFREFFKNFGIPEERYDFKPFNITDESTWENTLDKKIPNLVNTYGHWSVAKLNNILDAGYPVIHSTFPKIVNTSGSNIREIIKSKVDEKQKQQDLINAGLMPEVIGIVLKIFKNNYD